MTPADVAIHSNPLWSKYYALATGNGSYLSMAQDIMRNNLCNFFDDGSASRAFVYPRRVNGEEALFHYVFANDQDWALVFYLRVEDPK